jgi:hypothetical protein
VADRGQQRGAHPVGLFERLGRLRCFGQPTLFERRGGLGGEGTQNAQVGRGQPAS